MTIKRRDVSRMFLAIDPRGEEYIVYEVVEVVDASAPEEPDGEAWGEKGYRTQEGRAVDRLGKGRYRLLGRPAVLLASDDPDAP
ncbi:hypothetical protein [Paludisphaera mucosa]|uniref:Uncharacterized protein n=1 Tax=Paludisphaera mucosa TaxID=3030827 RepID=A0ABT6F6R6_9BACT|nr:hypothetical protein [Paludisphaera mucosa]MDG3003288.1 hypothetical protein [Paludisphaera mucosa]